MSTCTFSHRTFARVTFGVKDALLRVSRRRFRRFRRRRSACRATLGTCTTEGGGGCKLGGPRRAWKCGGQLWRL